MIGVVLSARLMRSLLRYLCTVTGLHLKLLGPSASALGCRGGLPADLGNLHARGAAQKIATYRQFQAHLHSFGHIFYSVRPQTGRTGALASCHEPARLQASGLLHACRAPDIAHHQHQLFTARETSCNETEASSAAPAAAAVPRRSGDGEAGCKAAAARCVHPGVVYQFKAAYCCQCLLCVWDRRLCREVTQRRRR